MAEVAQDGLDLNGLELESVAIKDIDQTGLEYFNPSNRFDADGLTRLIEDIEDRPLFNYFRLNGHLNVHAEYGYLVNEVTARIVAEWWNSAK